MEKGGNKSYILFVFCGVCVFILELVVLYTRTVCIFILESLVLYSRTVCIFIIESVIRDSLTSIPDIIP
jgi:hypothetical protein